MSEGTETLVQAVSARDGVTGSVRERLEPVRRALSEKPFVPHPLFTSGHAQTLAAYAWPRRRKLRWQARDHARLFEVEQGVQVLAHYRWQERKQDSPTMLLLHGLEGSTESIYILGTADKAFRAGFNVVRLNLRTCGQTEHLTPTIYHSGLTGDIRFVIRELVEADGFKEIYLVGFSMSGNMSLRLAGEEAASLPDELKGISAISPSVDLFAAADTIERRSNWIYQKSFMRSLHSRMRRKKKLFPELYDIRDLRRVRTIRDFDERFTAQHGGFKNADDYYARTSSLPLLRSIDKPTLIIHAEDDPFIPFEPLRRAAIEDNPHIIFLAPKSGGHVGFVAADTLAEDRFWAENRIVEFCRLLHEQIQS
ncbi:MAG TPA: alpha/beta fold hydrolase [Pyrinomonadaceae bacterium]|nr:alpha/beta fold hydrolase [Pyrinomonadaceae bacterium]